MTVTVFKVTGRPTPTTSRPRRTHHARPTSRCTPWRCSSSLATVSTTPQADRGGEGEGFPLAYVGDVVGTGSSRKSATNSVLWYTPPTTSRTSQQARRLRCIGGRSRRSSLTRWRTRAPCRCGRVEAEHVRHASIDPYEARRRVARRGEVVRPAPAHGWPRDRDRPAAATHP